MCKFGIASFASLALLFSSLLQANPLCKVESLPSLPDVRITSATQEAAPTPHCKVADVIGTETNFELLLPDDWNGKFVMD